DRQDQRIQFEAVEQPAEIGGEQDVPLVAGKAAIPRLPQGDGVGHGHPPLLADQPASSLPIETRRSRAALSSAVIIPADGLDAARTRWRRSAHITRWRKRAKPGCRATSCRSYHPERGDAAGSAKTGHGAWRITRSVVLPRSASRTP